MNQWCGNSGENISIQFKTSPFREALHIPKHLTFFFFFAKNVCRQLKGSVNILHISPFCDWVFQMLPWYFHCEDRQLASFASP